MGEWMGDWERESWGQVKGLSLIEAMGLGGNWALTTVSGGCLGLSGMSPSSLRDLRARLWREIGERIPASSTLSVASCVSAIRPSKGVNDGSGLWGSIILKLGGLHMAVNWVNNRVPNTNKVDSAERAVGA